jgi:hypothetical protein
VPAPEPPWYYAVPGERQGPFTTEQLVRVLAGFPDPRAVLVWRAGLETWTPAGAVEALSPHLPPANLPAGAAVPPLAEPPPPPAEEPHWFAVGIPKLIVMSTLTLGIYEVYWLYKHWRRVADRGDDVMPLARAIFAVLFCHGLFARIRDSAEENGFSMRAPVLLLTIGFIGLTLLARLPEPYWLVSMLSVWPLAHVQLAANQVSARLTPSHDRNTRLRGANWAAVGIGGLSWLLVLAASFLPAE